MVEIHNSDTKELLLNIVPRVAAAISICCAIRIIVTVLRSDYYRSRMYHRIMLGCAINIIVLDSTYLWGSAAIPVDDEEDFMGAAGTMTTCNISGFLYQYSVFVAPFYYFTLSIISYVALQNKFNFAKFYWMEKWIHLSVHLLPIISASYLFSIEAYNPIVSGCGFSSTPPGCGDQSPSIEEYVDCERGPENIGKLQFLLAGVPVIVSVAGTALMTSILYFHVRSQGQEAKPIVWSVAQQSALYMFLLLLIYSFRFIDAILTFGMGYYSFVILLFANSNEALIGMWFFIAYWYFRSDDPTTSIHNNAVHNKNNKINNSNDDLRDNSSGFNSNSRRSSLSSGGRRSSFFTKPEFSIFDGNKVPEDSPWAAFLTEGVDEDYDE